MGFVAGICAFEIRRINCLLYRVKGSGSKTRRGSRFEPFLLGLAFLRERKLICTSSSSSSSDLVTLSFVRTFGISCFCFGIQIFVIGPLQPVNMYNLSFVVHALYFVVQIRQFSGNLKRAFPEFVKFKTFPGFLEGLYR